MEKFYYKSPVGILEISLESKAIIGLIVVNGCKKFSEKIDCFTVVAKQLDEYFSGKRTEFELNILPIGTEFQKKVWAELLKIPYGKTKSYSEIAKAIGNPNAQRAVGSACNKNPIMIIIPCHRVVSKTGALTGFAYGLDIKEKLLSLES